MKFMRKGLRISQKLPLMIVGSAAGRVPGAAAELSKQAVALRAEVDKFLVDVRAA